MGTCWTLPKVSAKLHILWILALAWAFGRAHGIMKPEKQLSDVFINYISLFKLSYVLTVFTTFYYFQLIKTISSSFWSSLCEPGLACARCGLKAPSETCDVREETSWLASSSLYASLDGLPWRFLTRCTADRWQLPPCHSGTQKQHLATMSDALGMETVLQRLMHVSLLTRTHACSLCM